MKTYAILISLVVVGLVLLLAHSQLPTTHWACSWLSQLASVLLIGGVLGLLDKTMLHRDHFKQTRDLFLVHESSTQVGLQSIVMNANEYDYASLLRESKALSIVLNDGRTWIGARITDFQFRFSQDECTTDIYLVDPEGDFVATLARKTGYSLQEQKDKVHQATTRLIEEFSRAGGHGLLRVYHIPFFPTHSVFLGDKRAIITLYGISTGRRSVPLFVYGKIHNSPSLFADTADDIAKLRRESKCVFDSKSRTACAGAPALPT